VNTTPQQTVPANRPIISLSKFCQEAGISTVTAWRWRRRGWLVTVNIYGRQYIANNGLTAFFYAVQNPANLHRSIKRQSAKFHARIIAVHSAPDGPIMLWA
jgi:hypothetical protein